MKDPLLEQVQKDVTNEQKYRDGIPRIAVGIFLVITMLLQMNGSGNTFVVFIPLMPIIIESLRKRITYPRVGYAKVREPHAMGKPVMWMILGLLVAGAVVFAIRLARPDSLPQAENPHFLIMWATAIAVVLLGIIFVTRRRNVTTTWSLVAIVAITICIFAFKLHKEAVYLVVMAFGMILVLSGLISLRSFIKEYPVLTDDE